MKFKCSCGNPTNDEHIVGPYVFHRCDECRDRNRREVEFVSGGETFREKTVVCPHCDHTYDDYTSWGFEEGENEEVVCEICGHKFDLEVEDIRYFSTKRSLCEMDEPFAIDYERMKAEDER